MEDKEVYLKGHNSFNHGHLNVSADIFKDTPFFDARDIVQVKYEMLRCVANGEKMVTQAAAEHGFSREAFYKNKAMFESGGIEALIPKKTGPKGSHKFNEQGKVFVSDYVKASPDAKSAEIAKQMEKQIGLKIHPRTIHRYMQKKRDSR